MTTFHIRDDFDGSASDVLGRVPNVRTGTASGVTWRTDGTSFYPVPGDPEDYSNYGLLIVGDGTARFKGTAF